LKFEHCCFGCETEKSEKKKGEKRCGGMMKKVEARDKSV